MSHNKPETTLYNNINNINNNYLIPQEFFPYVNSSVSSNFFIFSPMFLFRMKVKQAIIQGKLKDVKVLINEFNVNNPIVWNEDNYCFNPLVIALLFKKIDIINFLLGIGAKVELTSEYMAPIIASSLCCPGEVTNNLLGSIMNWEEALETPLKAIFAFNLRLDLVMNKLNMCFSREEQALIYANFCTYHEENLKILFNIIDEQGYNPLMLSIINEEIGMMEFIQKKGGDIEAKDSHGNSALMVAAQYNKPIVVKYLKSVGADVNARDYHGRTALMLAAIEGGLEMIETLLNCEAEINYTDPLGDSALLLAIKQNKLEAAILLVNYHADIDLTNKNGDTALSLAILHSNKEMLEIIQDEFIKGLLDNTEEIDDNTNKKPNDLEMQEIVEPQSEDKIDEAQEQITPHIEPEIELNDDNELYFLGSRFAFELKNEFEV